jgi:hypothetical protein
MLAIFLGYKTHDRNAVPEVLYIGESRADGFEKAAASGQKYVRLGRLDVGTVVPVALSESPEHKKLREEAEAAHAKAVKDRAESEAAKTVKPKAEASTAKKTK